MHTAPRNGASIDRIYVHTNEGPEGDHSAQGLAAYLQRIDAGYHQIVDNTSTVICASDDQILYATGGDNTHSVSVCLIGYANQTAAQWADPYSKAEIERAAQVVANWCKRYALPVVRIRPGAPPTDHGIGGHVDCTSPSSGGHTDPGTYFPWASFLARVSEILRPPVDWVAIKKLIDWQVRVTHTPLRYQERSDDVTILKALLKSKGYYTLPGRLYGYNVRRAVHAYKLKNGWQDPDGTVVGGVFAKHILGL